MYNTNQEKNLDGMIMGRGWNIFFQKIKRISKLSFKERGREGGGENVIHWDKKKIYLIFVYFVYVECNVIIFLGLNHLGFLKLFE